MEALFAANVITPYYYNKNNCDPIRYKASYHSTRLLTHPQITNRGQQEQIRREEDRKGCSDEHKVVDMTHMTWRESQQFGAVIIFRVLACV